MIKRRALVVAVILLVPVAIHGIWDQWEAALFARDVRRIAERNEPTDLAPLRYPLASVEQRRAASLYAAAAHLSRDLIAPDGGSFLYNTDLSLSGLSDKTVEQATEVLTRAEPALPLLALATPLDFSGFGDVTSQLNENQSDLDTLNLQTCLKADFLSSRGHGDEAVEYLIQAARLQRTMPKAFYRDQARFRLYGSVRILLERGRASAASLTALQRAIQDWPDEDDPATQIINLRARLLDDAWGHSAVDRGWLYRIKSSPRQGFVEQIAFVALRPLYTRWMRRELNNFGRAIEIAKLPLPDRFKAAQEFADASSPQSVSANPSLLERIFLLPASDFSAAVLASDIRIGARDLAYRRTALAAMAIERYRADHGGRAPDRLSALVPDYLASVPLDPFSTAELKYRRNQDSYVVYSVDMNRADDGGELYGFGSGKNPYQSPYPLRRNDQMPGDIGIKVATAKTR